MANSGSKPEKDTEVFDIEAKRLRLAIRKIFKRLSLVYPQASDWPNQKDRIEAWAREAERYNLDGGQLMSAYMSRPASVYPPSIGELALLISPPISDEEIQRSMNRAVRVANTDEYHLLNQEEFWAFKVIGRWALKHEEQATLFRRWKALLLEAKNQRDLPPVPTNHAALRIRSKRSEASRQIAQKAIKEILDLLN